MFFRKKKDKSVASSKAGGGGSGVGQPLTLTSSDVSAPILIDRTGSTGSSGGGGSHIGPPTINHPGGGGDFRHGGSIKSVSSVTSSAGMYSFACALPDSNSGKLHFFFSSLESAYLEPMIRLDTIAAAVVFNATIESDSLRASLRLQI